MTEDLSTWLHAQLDDDAAALRGELRSLRADPLAAERVRHLLADIDAKRRILNEYDEAFDRRKRYPDDLASAGALLAMVAVAKLLALPYARLPGYRETWRP
jgi:hypothetical protein